MLSLNIRAETFLSDVCKLEKPKIYGTFQNNHIILKFEKKKQQMCLENKVIPCLIILFNFLVL